MHSVTNHLGIVAFYNETGDEKGVDQALRRLDPALFLDKERDGPGEPVFYAVKQWIGSAAEPIIVLEWRQDGQPLPLSYAIVDRVRAQEGRIADAGRRAAETNRRKRQRALDDLGAEVFEIGLDARKATGKTSALLPRGQYLRRSRDKRRARGDNV